MANYEQTQAFEAALDAAEKLLKGAAPTQTALAAAYNALVSGRAAMIAKEKPVMIPGDVNGNGSVTAAVAASR